MEKDNIISINKAKKNSFNPIVFTKNGTVLMKEKFLALILAGTVLATLTVTSLTKDVVDEVSSSLDENIKMNEFLNENGGYLTNKYCWHGDSADEYGYNHEGIAKGILNSADPDLAMYAVYDNFGFRANQGYDGMSNIDRVVEEIDKVRVENGEEPYGNFIGYLETKGTTLEVYEKNMPQYVEGEMLKSEAQSKINESGMKF